MLAEDKVYNRRTTSDDVFHSIHDQISNLKMLPGTKLSEVDIAKQFNVSRQPVREAFIRLSNLGLLLIRPQRATIVRKISLVEVSQARFIRLCIELEIARLACLNFNEQHAAAFEQNLKEQGNVIDSGSIGRFGALDASFHKLMCIAAGKPEIHQTIMEQKSKTDRLCALSLSDNQECVQVFEEHKLILEHMKNGDEDKLIQQMRAHLSRLDATIKRISKTHSNYFE